MIEQYNQSKNFITNKLNSVAKINEKQQIGIGGYTAGVRLKEEITYTSNITTNTVEDGTDISDHIITLPIFIKIEGEVGDIQLKDDLKYQAFKKIMRSAGKITQYLPSRTATQLTQLTTLAVKVDDTYAKIDDLIKDGTDIYNIFNDTNSVTETTESQKFCDFLTKVWQTKQIIRIETKHRVYENMAITMLTLNEQNGNYVSYEVILQEVRFAKLIIDNSSKYFSQNSVSSEAKNTTTSKKNKGTVTAEKATDKKATENKSALKLIKG